MAIMRAVRLEEPGSFIATELPDAPPPGIGQALVRVEAVGICGTDIHAFHGRQPFFTYPRITGHELAVVVEALGAETDGPAPGSRCCVRPYMHCGRCAACRRGRSNCCEHLAVLGVHVDGGMRERFVVRADLLHPVADLPAEAVALVETLVIGRHAVDRAALAAGEPVLVVGAGPIGQTVVQSALLAGARVAVADRDRRRLDDVGGRFAVERCLMADESLASELSAWIGGMPGCVFDATGHGPSMAQAVERCAHGGRIVWVGLVKDAVPLPDAEFHRRELSLHASRNGTAADFAAVISDLVARRIDAGSWVSHRCRLSDFVSSFASWMADPIAVRKAVVRV